MKRINVILSALIAVIAPTAAAAASLTEEKTFLAQADSESYACIVNDDTYFYSSANEDSGLFILPTTYYVKIISKSDDFCFVQYLEDVAEYKAVYGYCKTEALTSVDFTPARPYLYYTYTATYAVEGNSSGETGNFSTFTCDCIYYGDYKSGTTTYRYVSINGEFGYIPKTCEITYPLNTDYLPDEPTEEPASDVITPSEEPTTDVDDVADEQQTSSSPSVNGAGLGIIIALSAILIVVAIFVIAVRPRKKKNYSFDN